MATIVTRSGKGSSLTHAEVDANFTNLNADKLELAGGTMSGSLVLNADPTAGLQAATKQYVDTTTATAAQGALADSATQPSDLGTAATTAASDYATAAQGTLADSAVQPNDNPTFAGLTTTADVSFGDSDKAVFGAGSDLRIYHDGSNSYIEDRGVGNLYVKSNVFRVYNAAGNEISANFVQNGAVTLYHDNSAKLATTSTGVDVTGTVTMDGGSTSADFTFGDNDKALFGDGSDLQIYHNGSHSYIDDAGTGDLFLRSSNDLLFTNADGSETYARFQENGYVRLFYNGDVKFATTSTGVDVTGTITSDGLTVSNNGVGIADAIELENFSGESSYIKAKRGLTLSADYDNNSSAAQSNITFETDGSEAMRIDSNGNVGIGKVPATEALEVDGVVKASGGFIFGNTNSYMYEGSDDTINFRVGSDGPYVEFNDAGSGVLELGNAGGELALTSFGTERMRIDSNGNVLVGTTGSLVAGARVRASSIAATFEGEVTHAGGGGAVLWANRTSSDGWVAAWYRGSNSVGSISVTGSSTSYNTSSDYRLKTDAQPMTGASARVQALNPVNFEWIVSGDRVDGFLAHEAQAVVPEAVTGIKDAMRDEEYEVTPAALDDDGNVVTEAVMGVRSVPDYQGIDQSKLVPLLTAALQEALTKIDDMETRLAALEAI